MSKTFKDFAEACWDTHKQVGFKMKGGKRVPDCVLKNEEETQRVLEQKTQSPNTVRRLRWAFLPQRLIKEETHQQGQSNE